MAGEKHLYVVAQGDYTDSSLASEVWQCGLRFFASATGTPDPVGTFPSSWDVVDATHARVETDWRIDGNWSVEGGINDLDPADWLNDQLAPAWDTWMSQASISSVVRLRALKVYPIGAPTGEVIPAPSYGSGTPVTLLWTGNYPVGGGSATAMPLQTSVVCSHRTAQIGRKGRGRMYLPVPPTAAMSTAGSSASKLASGYISGALAAQVALLEDCAIDVAGAGFNCRPAITGTPWEDYGIIDQVQVGNYLDTQRRRRNALDESYSSANPSY